VELTWLDPAHPQEPDVAGAVALLDAARAVDRPHQLSTTVSSFIGLLRHGWDGDAPHFAVTRDPRGRVVGLLAVWLPHWDNTHLGALEATVDPLARRQGLGRRLFEAGVEHVRAQGRRLVFADCLDQPAAVSFAKAMGLERASAEVHRRQHLDAIDWAKLATEDEAAKARAGGYELIRIAGPTPPEMIADVARMTEAINDAPTDDLDIEDEVFSPERIRTFEETQVARQRRTYRVIARERATGVLGGHTMVAVENEQPGHGWQYDTSVLREHRGHRLGLVLKIDMLRWLSEREPQLRTIDTGNAASNDHMIQINEVLGYRVIATTISWQRHL
jgi:GNAT superfamily N-acetyltransferase/RimJ/RimL family protein N-acetyltransferase